jgi:hypothetical protein
MTRGRRSKIKGRAEKKYLWPNRGLKSRVCANYPISHPHKFDEKQRSEEKGKKDCVCL